MSTTQDTADVELPTVIQFDLEELQKLFIQLDDTPALANDPRFQDKVRTVITAYSYDFDGLQLDADQKNFLYDLNLDLMEGQLITIEGSPGGSSIAVSGLSWEIILTDLIDPNQPVNWIEVMLLPALDVALGSDTSAELYQLSK